jgi:hypothetical protein
MRAADRDRDDASGTNPGLRRAGRASDDERYKHLFDTYVITPLFGVRVPD